MTLHLGVGGWNWGKLGFILQSSGPRSQVGSSGSKLSHPSVHLESFWPQSSSHLSKSGQSSSHLSKLGQSVSHLSKSGQSWSHLSKSGQSWSHLSKSGHAPSHLSNDSGHSGLH